MPNSDTITMQVPDETDDFAELLRKIERERSVPCAGYKDRCLRRRVGVRMRATGMHTFPDYARLLDTASGEWEKLLAALTINVTRFFRDDAVFAALENQAYPLLRETFSGTLDVWSAGCSHGQEPYSLAMGLAETVGVERFRIEATDVDVGSMAATRAASYPELIAGEIPAERRARWMNPGDPAVVKSELRARVQVLRHDLLRDVMPVQRFHLICCRNVIIYFSREAQATLFDQLYNALMPGGILVLGKVETLIGPARDKFAALNLRERLFRRPLA
ncbi:MAG: protein-glutamate O-methyltransferase CheR [Gemmatimonadaceae bacterium]